MRLAHARAYYDFDGTDGPKNTGCYSGSAVLSVRHRQS
jgi:hypothetical protein